VTADTNKLSTLTGMIDLANSLESRKIEERMNLLVSDYDFETEDSSVIDLAVNLLL
jgi:enolase